MIEDIFGDEDIESKKCKKCGEKITENFVCKECKKKNQREYEKKNKEKINKIKKKYRKKDGKWYKEKGKEYYKKHHRQYHLKNKYGLTIDDYNKILKGQNCCCELCGRHKIEFKQRLSVDHNHKTKKLRGLLCTRCNTRLEVLENKEFNKRATEYLKKYQ